VPRPKHSELLRLRLRVEIVL